MFVRKLKQNNSKTYIQVVEKINGKYSVKKSFGSSQSESHLNDLLNEANLWIKNYTGIQELDFENERFIYQQMLSSITSHKLVGIDLVLGKIFDEIGFNKIEDSLFRDLV
ncbi:MAG: hypothetical protein P1P79_10630, partial [Lutibacter sp.]|nr:hypothetical protein [Lutibacter sp.]